MQNENLQKLIYPHTKSFDLFLDKIPSIIKALPEFEHIDPNYKLSLSFKKLEIIKPCVSEADISHERRVLPRDCRIKSATYRGRVSVTIEAKINDTHFTFTRPFGTFPVMVKSKLCNLYGMNHVQNISCGEDQSELGGYFIINGNEKVMRLLSIQKRNHVLSLYRESNTKKGRGFTEYCVSVRCVGPEEVGQIMFLHYLIDGGVVMRIYYKKREFFIPVILILKMLLDVTDNEIFDSLLDLDVDKNKQAIDQKRIMNLIYSIKELNLETRTECLEHVGSKFKILFQEKKYTDLKAGEEFIKRIVAVHLEENIDKFNFIIYAIRKLYWVADSKRCDDPDSQANHELITNGQIFSSLLKERLIDAYSTLNRSLTKLKDHSTDTIKEMVKSFEFNVGSRFEQLLSTGNLNLNISSDITESVGLTVLAEKINYYRFISHFRSVNRGNFFAQLKTTSVRKLKPETWGFYCPVHTPDGTPCGIITHLSMKTEVITECNDFDVSSLVNAGMVPFVRGCNKLIDHTSVFVDGKLVGFLGDECCDSFVLTIRRIRADDNLKHEIVYIKKDMSERSLYSGVFIFNGPGRLMRRVMNPSQKLEYIGIMEQLFLHITEPKSQNKEELMHNSNLKNDSFFSQGNTTFESYSEIDNTSFLSVVAGLTPFSDFNQSPRNMYQCQMAKQTMGTAFHNIANRVDNKSYKITYPQVPIVATKTYHDYGLNEYPMGINAIVAVLSYTAYDMEDAMVINKASMERGFFCGSVYKNEVVEIDNKDDHIVQTPEIGAWLGNGDLFYRVKKSSGDIKNVFYKGFERGIVDTIRFYDKYNLNTVAFRLTLRIPRNPSIGDKFCSRHGQKGVCSMHWPVIDMPFTEDGLVPDIIINPHAFPSRMTIGMLVESMAGKSGTITGKIQDGTPFQFEKRKNGAVEYFGEELKNNGYNYHGNQMMYSGVSGTPLAADVFIGVVYYQRLRHMVNDKFQVRSTGAVDTLTKQPVGGRKKKGGVRLGEMERDALIAHGCSNILYDRLMYASDHSVFTYCMECKSVLFSINKTCLCGGKVFKDVELPYVFKYLCAELVSMNIRVRMEIE